MIRIGIISDTHISGQNISKLNKVLEVIADGCDIIVHTGDFTSFSAAAFLEESTNLPLIGVAGNMDNAEIRSNFPHKRSFNAENIKIGVIHGWGAPYDLKERIDKEFKNEDIIIFGHTHIPCDETFNGRRFLNPGSATESRNGLGNSIGILEITGKKAVFKIHYL